MDILDDLYNKKAEMAEKLDKKQITRTQFNSTMSAYVVQLNSTIAQRVSLRQETIIQQQQVDVERSQALNGAIANFINASPPPSYNPPPPRSITCHSTLIGNSSIGSCY